MSSHIDLGAADSVAVFRSRMDFARRIGARVINTNAAVRDNAEGFARNIEPLARHAEAIGLTIALENPGDGRDNLANTAAGGLELVTRTGRACVRLNYDPANTASHRPDLPDPVQGALAALPGCAHLHLKDVRRNAQSWTFTPLGEGELDLGRLLDALADWPSLPVGIELPLRLHRDPTARPVRRAAPVPLPEIEAAILRSLDFATRHGLSQ
jgi:sugar phosphate isomerase/epimerase